MGDGPESEASFFVQGLVGFTLARFACNAKPIVAKQEGACTVCEYMQLNCSRLAPPLLPPVVRPGIATEPGGLSHSIQTMSCGQDLLLSLGVRLREANRQPWFRCNT